MKTGRLRQHGARRAMLVGAAGLCRPASSGAVSPFVNLAGRSLWHNAVLPSASRAAEHDTVASDILGVSGRWVIRKIIAGCEDPGDLA